MLPLTILFLSLILIINTLLWRLYRRGLQNKIKAQQRCLNNAYAYIDELQQRCERYRTAAVTEALASQTRTSPVVKVYPIQLKSTTWIIENNLN